MHSTDTAKHGLTGRTSNRWKGKAAEKTETLSIRCTADDKTRWKEAAAVAGLSLADWIARELNRDQ